MPDPSDKFNDLHDPLISLNTLRRANEKGNYKRGNKRKTEGLPVDLNYQNFELKKYAKQLQRLISNENLLYRQFLDHAGKVSSIQYRLPEHLMKETLYSLHILPIAVHIRINRIINKFGNRFYFPDFTECFVQTIKNCLTFVQQKILLIRH